MGTEQGQLRVKCNIFMCICEELNYQLLSFTFIWNTFSISVPISHAMIMMKITSRLTYLKVAFSILVAILTFYEYLFKK